MTIGWPRTLAGRVALIVCGGLALAHALSFWIILRERGEFGQSMMLAYLGRDVAASVAILERVPPAERAEWLPRLARQNYRYTLGAAAPAQAQADGSALAGALARSVAGELGDARVGAMSRGDGPEMVLPLRLLDGTALTLHLAPPRATISRTSALLLAFQFAALALAAWFGVRLAVRPMARLAAAANALEPGSSVPMPNDPRDPLEVTQAARAFNAMQQRIEAQLAERMQLLAAISHDLQTPITRAKLRADAIDDAGLRRKLHADMDAMQALVEEGLAYARTAQAAQEAPRAVDLQALLDGLVCDAVDAGHRAELTGRCDAPLFTRVQALRRVVVNLLDNAIKFGGAAQVVLETVPGEVHIVVRDRGAGIPAQQLEAVFQPFYRVEGSRSRDTGGTGLGLAIARQLALALSGRLTLVNRPGGGLEARLVLPDTRPPV